MSQNIRKDRDLSYKEVPVLRGKDGLSGRQLQSRSLHHSYTDFGDNQWRQTSIARKLPPLIPKNSSRQVYLTYVRSWCRDKKTVAEVSLSLLIVKGDWTTNWDAECDSTEVCTEQWTLFPYNSAGLLVLLLCHPKDEPEKWGFLNHIHDYPQSSYKENPLFLFRDIRTTALIGVYFL